MQIFLKELLRCPFHEGEVVILVTVVGSIVKGVTCQFFLQGLLLVVELCTIEGPQGNKAAGESGRGSAPQPL